MSDVIDLFLGTLVAVLVAGAVAQVWLEFHRES